MLPPPALVSAPPGAQHAGEPLSALAFRQALADGAPGLSLAGDPAVPQEEYFAWVREYLHYLDVPFDNQVGVPDRSRAGLMLVPEGSAPPPVFQRKLPLDYLTYTGSVEEFYPVP